MKMPDVWVEAVDHPEYGPTVALSFEGIGTLGLTSTDAREWARQFTQIADEVDALIAERQAG